MTEDARIDTGPAAHRGFLFSDMRGFTAFAERHGNAAAAAAVSRFLDLARTAIARHEGAELKTEGDAIHAVFPSAASAVMCGLDIVDAAAELNEREPDMPLDLGVGVHSGDAVETAEGYIGSAVNIAARLCAAARPGEVLVSSSVKATTQADIPVGFIAHGRQRLKGIREPVQVYAVTRDLTARAAVVLPRLGGLLAATGVAAVALVAAVVLSATVLPGGVIPASPTPQPAVVGPLQIGTYATQAFQPAFTFELEDPGWAVSRDAPRLFGLVREDAPAGNVFLTRIREVIDNPCLQGGNGDTGSTVDVIGQLSDLEHVQVTDEVPVKVDGVAGRQVDVTISEGSLAACGGLVGAEVALFGLADETWSATPGERFRLASVTVGDEEVTILMSIDWSQAHSVPELEGLFAIGSKLLDTVAFQVEPAAS